MCFFTITFVEKAKGKTPPSKYSSSTQGEASGFWIIDPPQKKDLWGGG